MDGVDLDDQIYMTSICCSAQECKIVYYSIILWSLAYDITFFTSNHRIIRGWMKEDLLSLSTLVSWIIHWNGWGQFWMAIWLFLKVHNCDIVGRGLSILWAMLDYSIMLWSLVYNKTFDTPNHWITRCWIIVFLICVQMYLESFIRKTPKST